MKSNAQKQKEYRDRLKVAGRRQFSCIAKEADISLLQFVCSGVPVGMIDESHSVVVMVGKRFVASLTSSGNVKSYTMKKENALRISGSDVQKALSLRACLEAEKKRVTLMVCVYLEVSEV